jgi:uncharacterized protein
MIAVALENKRQFLLTRLRELRKVVIGFSGGIDSTLLLRAAIDAIGSENVWAVTGNSESLLPEELESCRQLARQIGLKPDNFIEIKTNELLNPNYKANPIDRCFYCKQELFSRLQEVARQVGAVYVLDGSNADDKQDWRPGQRAAGELGIISPMAEIGFAKSEIRELARQYDLPNWNKPSLACLSSRIPYGSEVNSDKLSQIARAERYLRTLGFTQLRVRHHDKIARIELLPSELTRLYSDGLVEKVIAEFKEIGFIYVTVDLQGYRSGSMKEIINKGNSNER